MGMIVAFYAVPAATYADTADACEVAARSPQVASVSINSRAVGDVLAAFSATYLSPVVADADMTARAAYVPAANFSQARGTSLASQMPLDAAVLALCDEIDQALSEARWRQKDLLVVAR